MRNILQDDIRARHLLMALICFLALALPAITQAAAPQLRAMILDGESSAYHDWKATTPALHRMLEQTGLFHVDVVTVPEDDLGTFAPDFSRYAVVVFNYDAPDGRWPSSLQLVFERYVRQGGGVVLVHAANNAFPGWRAFNQMSGLGGWRNRTQGAGPYWYLDGEGQLMSDDAPGPAGSHGRRQPFQITVSADHPVTRGLPAVWLHPADELYAQLRGPGGDMTVLATAWSDPANMGTGRHEPQLLTVAWGKGRIFHTTLGHDLQAMAGVDFVVTFQRGAEWAATGEVTQTVPPDFPSQSAARFRSDILAIGASYGVHRQP